MDENRFQQIALAKSGVWQKVTIVLKELPIGV